MNVEPLKFTKYEVSDRGFYGFEFRDGYGSECSMQESSNAEADCLWLGVSVDFEKRKCTRMHLTAEQVRQLLPALTYFAEHGSFRGMEEP